MCKKAIRPAAKMSSNEGLPLQVRCTTRQGIAQVKEHHIQESISGGAGGHRPWITGEIRVLSYQVQRAVAGILPHGLVKAQRAFLNGSVLRCRTSDKSIAHR